MIKRFYNRFMEAWILPISTYRSGICDKDNEKAEEWAKGLIEEAQIDY